MKNTNPANIKIIHILADGRRVDDIKGHVVGRDAEDFYRVLKELKEGIKNDKGN